MESSGDIDTIVEKISVVYDIGDIIRQRTKKPRKKNATKQKKWFDKSCFELANKLKNIAKLLTPQKTHTLEAACAKPERNTENLLNPREVNGRTK